MPEYFRLPTLFSLTKRQHVYFIDHCRSLYNGFFTLLDLHTLVAHGEPSGSGRFFRRGITGSRLYKPRVTGELPHSTNLHLIRNSMEYAGWKDRKALTGALKPICNATNAIESLNR
jgi:hypothetical protein